MSGSEAPHGRHPAAFEVVKVTVAWPCAAKLTFTAHQAVFVNLASWTEATVTFTRVALTDRVRWARPWAETTAPSAVPEDG